MKIAIMIKKLFCKAVLAPFFGAILFLCHIVEAQNDASRIALHTVISEKMFSKLPPAVKRLMESKLGQIATQNGMGGFGANPKFIITASVIVVEKNVAPTTPPMMTASVDVTLFIADAETQTMYQSVNLTLKGAGKDDNAAVVDAIQKLNPANAMVKQFVAEGKNKILKYYEDQCDVIITEAMALSSQSKYLEAIAKLTSVPSVSTNCFNKVMSAVGPVYQKYIDLTCIQKLSAASLAWHSNQNTEGANMAREILQTIDPQAACMPSVIALADTIKIGIAKNENKQWEFKTTYATNLTKEQILDNAIKAVNETTSRQKDINIIVRDPDDWLF